MARQPARRPRPQAPSPRTRREARSPAGKPSTIGALAEAMEGVAPARLAEPWDNVGLLLGDRAAPCGRVLVAVDWTPAVLEEALALRVDAVVSYHPPIFDALKRLSSDDPKQRTLLDAAQAGIALLSPHTALDAVKGGVNDWLAEGIAGGAEAIALSAGFEPLRPASTLPKGEAFKLVVFVPAEASARVREALAQAGAGAIGNYDRCTTRGDVTGTFRGGPGSDPAVGTRGKLEEVREERIETVTSAERLPWAVAALRAVHPYEEPAFEIHALAARPSLDEGAGRLLSLRTPATVREIAARLRRHLGTRRIDCACAPGTEGARHARIALCPGAGASFLPEAAARGATLLVTGEARHHDHLAAMAAGVTLVLPGHTQTERGYMPILAQRLARTLPGVSFTTSQVDLPPVTDASGRAAPGPGARPRRPLR
jgi:dinuclear metal center YbgI/SA1388 family protein